MNKIAEWFFMILTWLFIIYPVFIIASIIRVLPTSWKTVILRKLNKLERKLESEQYGNR